MKPSVSVTFIGHTEYTRKVYFSKNLNDQPHLGEINNARKLSQALSDIGIHVNEILDIYELFEIENIDDPRAQYCNDIFQTNISLAEVGQTILTDVQSEPFKIFRNNLEKALPTEKTNILILMTWPAHAFLLLSSGIQNHFPIIAKEYSYMRHHYQLTSFPLAMLDVSLVLSESLLGCENSLEAGLSESKVGYLPNIAPTANQPRNEREKKKFRHDYISQLLQKSDTPKPFDDQTLIIGCPSRGVRRKCIEILIFAVKELYKKFPHIRLLLKGGLSSEFDDLTQYSEKFYQILRSVEKEPWFLWDQTHTPYPDILKVYETFDLCCIPTGAEIGCNTIAEVCSLGIPTVLQDASVIPYLYSNMASFVESGDLITKAHWVFTQPRLDDLIRQLKSLIVDDTKRKNLGKEARALGQQRFGPHQISKRMPLFLDAAQSFFSKDSKMEEYENKISELLKKDFLPEQPMKPLDEPRPKGRGVNWKGFQTPPNYSELKDPPLKEGVSSNFDDIPKRDSVLLGNITSLGDYLPQIEQILEADTSNVDRLVLYTKEIRCLNYLLPFQPTEIAFYSENTYTLEYSQLITSLISLSDSHEEFISRVFSRSISRFLSEGPPFLPFSELSILEKKFESTAGTLKNTLNEFTQWAYLDRPYDKKLLSDTLSKLSDVEKTRFETFLAPFQEGLLVLEHPLCQRLLPCWPINETVPFSENKPYGLNAYKELEPNTNTFHFGHGWLKNQECFNRIKKSLSEAKISFLEIDFEREDFSHFIKSDQETVITVPATLSQKPNLASVSIIPQ